MSLYLWIALGSGLGGIARHALSGLVNPRLGDGFPWGTLLVNVSGCLVIGFVAAATAAGTRFALPEAGRQALMTGVLGGYTTFSAFSLQTLALAQQGAWLRAGAYVLGSVALCLLAVWLGHFLAVACTAPRGA